MRISSVRGLNAAPPYGQLLPGHTIPVVADDAVRKIAPLGLVHLGHGIEHARRNAVLTGDLRAGQHVLGQARPAKPEAREEVGGAEPAVRDDSFAHLAHVGAARAADVGEFVHHADTRGEHDVHDVLGHFRTADIHGEERFAGAEEWRIQFAHDLNDPHVVGADDNPVGPHEVVHGRAFLEKLGIHHHVEGLFRDLSDLVADLFGRANRTGALVDDDAVAGHVLGDAACGVHHLRKVGAAFGVGRRAHADERKKAVFHGLSDVRGEAKPLFLDIADNQLLEAGFVNGELCPAERFDAAGVVVDTDDRVAVFGEAGSHHEAHVARTHDRYPHALMLLSM